MSALPVLCDDETAPLHEARLPPVRCRSCRPRFNERSGSGFNELQYPTDVVLRAVLWRLVYKLGFRDVAELLLQRGYEVTQREREARQAPDLALPPAARQGRGGAAARRHD